MSINIFFALIFSVATLVSLAVAGFLFVRFSKTTTHGSHILGRHHARSALDGKRRVLDIVSQIPLHTAAIKCGNCNATVDSTAELSADGKIRCNYCNEWSSIL
ncbi:MAG: hypothetical protein NTX48_11035 [Planctomycetales bacterium]|nr:hypothetical protein [Planctomycetales bacterium]